MSENGEQLLSNEQREGLADLWARRPWLKRGPCKTCDHHGTLEPDDRCLWCHSRERKARAHNQESHK
jgi:hypothetical protein